MSNEEENYSHMAWGARYPLQTASDSEMTDGRRGLDNLEAQTPDDSIHFFHGNASQVDDPERFDLEPQGFPMSIEAFAPFAPQDSYKSDAQSAHFQPPTGSNTDNSMTVFKSHECIDPSVFNMHDECREASFHPQVILNSEGYNDEITLEHDPLHDRGEHLSVDNEHRTHHQHLYSATPDYNPWAPPWNPLDVNSVQPRPSTQIHSQAYPSASSYTPSASMQSGGGRSSFSNDGETGTSSSSNEPYVGTARSLSNHNSWLISDASTQAAPSGKRPANGRGRVSLYGQQLSVPSNGVRASRASSPSGSILSVTPAHEPDVLLCLQDGCPKTFQGKYRRGTRQRHMRLKHGKVRGQEEKEYPCEANGCHKVYLRQDARLKHYRKKHEELNPAVAVPRK